LSSMILSVSDFARAIENEDIPTLKGLPEIGPATAKRIIAELKGKKLVKFMLLPSEGGVVETGPRAWRQRDEAVANEGHAAATSCLHQA
ncbi:MAG: helix-hairpin-helix domain-containing protein, partial [Gaiellaceae bacterium]